LRDIRSPENLTEVRAFPSVLGIAGGNHAVVVTPNFAKKELVFAKISCTKNHKFHQ
jgi:hypothetical protein